MQALARDDTGNSNKAATGIQTFTHELVSIFRAMYATELKDHWRCPMFVELRALAPLLVGIESPLRLEGFRHDYCIQSWNLFVAPSHITQTL